MKLYGYFSSPKNSATKITRNSKFLHWTGYLRLPAKSIRLPKKETRSLDKTLVLIWTTDTMWVWRTGPWRLTTQKSTLSKYFCANWARVFPKWRHGNWENYCLQIAKNCTAYFLQPKPSRLLCDTIYETMSFPYFCVDEGKNFLKLLVLKNSATLEAQTTILDKKEKCSTCP